MKRCSKCGEFKELVDFPKDSSKPDGYRYSCKACNNTERNKEIHRKAALKHYHKNSDKYAKYREDNREKCRERVANSYLKSREARLEYARQYYQENKDDLKLMHKEYDNMHPEVRKAAIQKWRLQNPGYINSIIAKRRAARKKATPTWANLQKIRQFYIYAKQLTEQTGILHVVDHIVPLQHDLVCGLHVEFNLQVIPATENSRKSNKFIVG